MNIEDLRRIYLIILLSQFIYCASIWYVLNEKHDFKQKKNATLFFMKNIQTRATQIILEIFKNIVDATLNVELYLFSIRQQLDMMSEWWFWNNQKEEEHFFEDVNSMY